VVRRRLLQVVGFIQDDHPVGEEDRPVRPPAHRLPDHRVGQEQVVVDHQKLGPLHLPPGLEKEAALEEGAIGPEAPVGVGRHLLPHLRGGLKGQV